MYVKDTIKGMQHDAIEPFQAVFGNEELLAKIIEFFPHPILIYTSDGKAVMVNRAMLDEFNIPGPEEVIGKFNVLEEPFIIKAGIMDDIKRAFRGETVILQDIRVPLEDIAALHEIQDFDVEAVYQDITLFPIPTVDRKAFFVAVLLINRRVYRYKDEIAKAKEYMESHWLDSFDVKEAAKAAGLSRTHFVRLFKKHTGMTPHDYYINLKISKIKEKLSDSALSIAQIFAACGVDYSGHFAKVFKERVGLSPSQYRNMANKK
jgi:AraC-like DNA-binding protein